MFFDLSNNFMGRKKYFITPNVLLSSKNVSESSPQTLKIKLKSLMEKEANTLIKMIDKAKLDEDISLVLIFLIAKAKQGRLKKNVESYGIRVFVDKTVKLQSTTS